MKPTSKPLAALFAGLRRRPLLYGGLLCAKLALVWGIASCGPSGDEADDAAGDEAGEAAARVAPTAEAEASAEAGAEAEAEAEAVAYDLRMIRPSKGDSLEARYEAMAAAARAEGKRVAVLFTADWCQRCERLTLELGNTHARARIGDVRVFMLKEEEWDAAARMDEYNELRRRWAAPLGIYPFFVLTLPDDGLDEEMKDAIERLEGEGLQPTLDNWFANPKTSSS